MISFIFHTTYLNYQLTTNCSCLVCDIIVHFMNNIVTVMHTINMLLDIMYKKKSDSSQFNIIITKLHYLNRN